MVNTKEFIKKNYVLIGILLLALIIRLYYFFITSDQTLWWDELCYGILAKNLVLHQWDNARIIIGETNIRPMFLPILWSFLMRLDLSEVVSKFILEIIPSFFVVLFTYFVGKTLYNKRIGLIASFIIAISWMTIFYSVRFMTHIPGLLASLASIYLFFKAIETDKINLKYFSLSIFLFFISVLFRWNYGLVGFAFLLVILFNLKFIKQKAFWIGGLIGSIPIITFFIINLVKNKSLFPALAFVSSHASESVQPFAYYALNFIPHILQTPFLIMFILGLIIVLGQIILGFDSISQIKKLKSHLFLLSLLILNLSFLIFYIRYAEDRYLFESIISMVLIISIFLDFAYVYIKKYNKIFAIILIVGLLSFGGYAQYKYGGSMIIGKKDSYAQMKETFVWMKDNLPRDSVVLGIGIEPYTIYYGGLIPIEHESWMNEGILNKSIKVDYLIHHAFVGQGEDYTNFINSLQQDSQISQIIYVAYFDVDKQQPAVILAKYLQ